MALVVNDCPAMITWPIDKLTGLETSRTVSVPRTVLPSAETSPFRKEMTGNRAASRNRADSTFRSRSGFRVLKLAVSISA